MPPVEIHRRIAELSKVHIFYRDTEGTNDPILCLHGRWGRGETWVDFIRHYGKDYRIIAPDQRGHGFSEKPLTTYSTQELAEDMVGLLDAVEIEKAIIVGHSMGGAVAGYLAAKHPERVRAAAILDKSAAGPDESAKSPLRDYELKDPITGNWPLPFRSLADAKDHIRTHMESELGYEYFMNSLFETVEGYRMMFSPQAIVSNINNYRAWYDLLPRIRCPVLLLRAKRGEAVPDADFEKMQSMITNCMAREMSDPDHNVFLSKKEEFYGYFDEFLEMLKP